MGGNVSMTIGAVATALSSLVVTAFLAVSSPVVDNTEWSTGHAKGIVDSVTGDYLLFRHIVADNKVALIGSQNQGASWSTIAADVSNPNGGGLWPNRVDSVVQDANGKVHAISYTKDGTSRYVYMRFALVRSGGHVIGITLEQDAILLTDHGFNSSSDPRGNIYLFKLGGVDTIVLLYQGAQGADLQNIHVYACMATSLTPSSAADFVKLDGTAGDSALFSNSGSLVKCDHQMQTLMAQIGSTEDLYFFYGQINADYSVGVSYSTDYDLNASRIPRSGAVWGAVGSAVLISQVSAGGSVSPMIMAVKGTTNKAWIYYYDPAEGVTFAYFDTSGTLHNHPISSPDPTLSKSAMGVFNVDDSDHIWCVHNLNGIFNGASTPTTGKLCFWNGSTWNITNDATARVDACFFHLSGMTNGVVAGRVNGDNLGTITGIDMAVVRGGV